MAIRLWLILLCLCVEVAGIPSPIRPITQEVPPEDLPGGDEIAAAIGSMNGLIEATEETLAAQKRVRQLLTEYRQTKMDYMNNQQDRERVIQLVKLAHVLMTNIRDEHLADAFDPDFLHELSFFSQIASKKSGPKL